MLVDPQFLEDRWQDCSKGSERLDGEWWAGMGQSQEIK